MMLLCMLRPLMVAAALATGEFGSWRLTLEDETYVSAAEWKESPCVSTAADGSFVRVWTSPALDVTVTETPAANGRRDARISVENRGVKAVTACEFPGRLRFRPEDVKRFVYPGRGNFGLGMAFNEKFFRPTGQKNRQYLCYRVKYPTLFADFAFLETTRGETVAVYGLQPRDGVEPWQNRTPFNPGETAVGGDAKGGWYEHSFALWAKCGSRWTSPRVRLTTGLTLEAALADYSDANGYRMTLAQKVRNPARLEALKQAPLVFLGGADVKSLSAIGAKLPTPSLLHVASYLHGGFDKQYPDHLPPHPSFGTQAEFAAAVKRLQARGHLFCPYTNPTWWCDDPPGPTFRKWGKGALSIDRKGEYRHEVYGYGKNPGWQQCYFHPGSHEGNRRTVRQFSEEIPVDLLFEDQVCGRDWVWDFNPCSPSPTAHSEGMISLAQEHCRTLPIACEDGWDRIAEYETALMGCTWRILPLSHCPVGITLFKETDFPADTWTIEPVSLRLFHDKCLFYLHDLGSAVMSDQELPWILGLGYQISWQIGGSALYDGVLADWYGYLHTIQREIISKIAGQPLVSFRHDRAPLLARGGDSAMRSDDGVIEAQYGDVNVLANLGDVPRTVGGKRLAPYGYWVEGPDFRAFWLDGEPARIESGDRRWERALIPLGGEKVPPRPQTDDSRKVGVVWLGEDAPRLAVSVKGSDWLSALPGSVRIGSAEELAKALAEGPGQWRAIVNAHGECFPERAEGTWREMTQAILRYVRAGGHWFETAGVPFNNAHWRDADGTWRHDALHGASLPIFKIQIKPFGPDGAAKPQKLRPAADGDWLPEDVRKLLADRISMLDRGVGGGFGNDVLSVVENVRGECWFGATREGGHGALWRIGAIRPDPVLSKAVVAAALEHIKKAELPPVPDIFGYRFAETSGKECSK